MELGLGVGVGIGIELGATPIIDVLLGQQVLKT